MQLSLPPTNERPTPLVAVLCQILVGLIFSIIPDAYFGKKVGALVEPKLALKAVQRTAALLMTDPGSPTHHDTTESIAISLTEEGVTPTEAELHAQHKPKKKKNAEPVIQVSRRAPVVTPGSSPATTVIPASGSSAIQLSDADLAVLVYVQTACTVTVYAGVEHTTAVVDTLKPGRIVRIAWHRMEVSRRGDKCVPLINGNTVEGWITLQSHSSDEPTLTPISVHSAPHHHHHPHHLPNSAATVMAAPPISSSTAASSIPPAVLLSPMLTAPHDFRTGSMSPPPISTLPSNPFVALAAERLHPFASPSVRQYDLHLHLHLEEECLSS
jgi:hypothetical protein